MNKTFSFYCNYLWLLSLVFIFTDGQCQILLFNSDFEQLTDFNGQNGWSKCVDSDSPDYFTNTIMEKITKKYVGGTTAYSGNGFAGIFLHRSKEVREYIQIKIDTALTKDTAYYFEFYVFHDVESNVSCNSIGAFFSMTQVSNYRSEDMVLLKPQISNPSNHSISTSNNWILVSGTFIAQGGERYIVLGNFKPDCVSGIVPLHHNYDNNKLKKWNLREDETASYCYVDHLKLIKCESMNKRKTVTTVIPSTTKKLINDTIALSPSKNSSTKLAAEPAKKIDVIAPKVLDQVPIFTSMTQVQEKQLLILRKVEFDKDKCTLKSDAIIELNELLRLLRQNPSMTIEIRGHTDDIGTQDDNIVLSLNRAKTVQQFLINNEVSKDRISCFGYGSSMPISDNLTEEGRAQNRRVEFYIVTK